MVVGLFILYIECIIYLLVDAHTQKLHPNGTFLKADILDQIPGVNMRNFGRGMTSFYRAKIITTHFFS